MARKTAMGKEPGNVSIALPQSEKNRLNRLGKFQPGDPGMAKKLIDGAKPLPSQRLSPGVYRNSAGQLVGSKGQALPGQKQQSLTERALNAANRAMSGDRPAPRPNQRLPQQPMSQQEIDLANQAMNRISDTLNQYPVPKSPMDPGFGPNSSLANLQNLYPNEDMNRPIFDGFATNNGPANPYNNYRPIQPNERGRYGIDPRDPNQYQIGPNGQIMGTYMGWSPNGNMGNLNQMINRQQQAAQQPQSVSGLLQRNR